MGSFRNSSQPPSMSLKVDRHLPIQTCSFVSVHNSAIVTKVWEDSHAQVATMAKPLSSVHIAAHSYRPHVLWRPCHRAPSITGGPIASLGAYPATNKHMQTRADRFGEDWLLGQINLPVQWALVLGKQGTVHPTGHLLEGNCDSHVPRGRARKTNTRLVSGQVELPQKAFARWQLARRHFHDPRMRMLWRKP